MFPGFSAPFLSILSWGVKLICLQGHKSASRKTTDIWWVKSGGKSKGKGEILVAHYRCALA